MTLTAVRLGGRPEQPLLLVGPSLGTSATTLWSAAAALLAEDFQVVGWDLPGHGHNTVPLGEDPTTVASLAGDVLELVDHLGDGGHDTFHYAGDSVGGAVGLQLVLDAPERVASATLLCTGARIGTAESWQERIAQVRAAGTSSLVSGSAERWFGPGFLDRQPERGSALLRALTDADDEGYVAVCRALRDFDVRSRLGDVVTPLLAVAGRHDVATPPDLLAQIADGVQHGRLVVLDDAAHLAPAEQPTEVARLIREHILGPREDDQKRAEAREAVAIHLRTALRNGLSVAELRQVLEEIQD